MEIAGVKDINRMLAKLLEGKLLGEDELTDLSIKAIEVLSLEKKVVQLPAPIVVVGDIHGQFYDLMKIFDMTGKPPVTRVC